MIRSHQYRADRYGGPCSYKWYVVPCDRPRDEHEEVDFETKRLDERVATNMALKAAIVVYVDLAGAPKMIEHILDGSLKEFHPSVTVGSSLYGHPIPMMNKKGEVPE